MKIPNETRVKSVILDKLSLYYMGLRPIFNEIAILESMVQNSTVSFPWINIERPKKAQYRMRFPVLHLGFGAIYGFKAKNKFRIG